MGERKRHVRKLLGTVEDLYTTGSIRRYLGQFFEKPYVFENHLKALRLFYRFVKKEEIVSSFKFPAEIIKPPKVPSKADIQKFYSFITDLRLKAIFLTLASSGLRVSEALSILTRPLLVGQRKWKTPSSMVRSTPMLIS